MNTALIIILVILGSTFGSFSGATIWRLRARDLKSQKKLDKAASRELNQISFLTKLKLSNDRSHCLNCKHQLSTLDLIPIVSWLYLRGRCRYCNHPIGKFELYMEVLTALYFVLSYIYWPVQLDSSMEITKFVLWLVIGVGLMIIAGYDSKWSEIPSIIMYAVIFLSLIWTIMSLSASNFQLSSIYSLVGAIAVLSGFYLLIYLVSKGKWIGFGDIELGLALALLLMDWRLAFINLFVANFLGTLIVLPGLIAKKIKKSQSVPFGPLYIAGFFVAFLWGNELFIAVFPK